MSSSSGRFVQAAGGVAVVAVCIVGHFSLTWFATRSVQAEHPWIFGFVVAILVEAVLAVACLAGPPGARERGAGVPRSKTLPCPYR